jgi:Subtilase family/Bacterial pre-peptidase C-terminal domain
MLDTLRKLRRWLGASGAGRRRRARPAVELLEDRTALSRFDGSFDAVMLTALRADPAFQNVNGRGIGIAVIDTGVYAQNPELRPNFAHYYDAVTGWDSSYTDVNQDVRDARDPRGHGSHVAGIAASSNPDLGVAPGARLIGIRALPGPGEAWPANRDPIADGLSWVLQHQQQFNIRVVNMSLGDYSTNVNDPDRVQQLRNTDGEARLIARLEALGVTVVSASGNNYAQFVAAGAEIPAAFSTLSVANTWAVGQRFGSAWATAASLSVPYGAVERESARDRLAAGSQRSTLPNQVAAPGQDILSTWNGDGGKLRNTIGGTSMAAPLVSGVVALMQQAAYAYSGTYLSTAQVRTILQQTGDAITDADVPSNGRVPLVNGRFDWNHETWLPETGITLKRVNAYHALQRVRQLLGGGGAGDTNNTIARAIDLGSLDGTRVFTGSGAVGHDGQTQVGDNDVDLWKVTLTSPGSLTVRLDPVAGGQNFDTYLRVFDAGGAQIAADDDSAGDRYSALTTSRLQPGTYYLGVSSYNNASYNISTGAGAAAGGSHGDYQMTVNLGNPDPNGVIAGAGAFAGLPASFAGTIGTDPPPANSDQRVQVGPGDVDMFQVTAPDDGDLVVDVDAATLQWPDGQSAVDSYVRVFDAAGNQLAFNDDDGQTTDSFLRFAMARGQTVYVAVSDYANRAYDANDPYSRSGAGPGGSYRLALRFDNRDRNGTLLAALPFNVGDTVQSQVGSDPLPGGGRVTVGTDGAEDVDFFQFTPAADGLLDVSAAGENGFIPYLSLWSVDRDAQGNVTDATRVAETLNGSTELVYAVQAGHDYYMAVTGRGNTDFLWYAPATGSGGQSGFCTISSQLRAGSDVRALSDNGATNLGVTDAPLGLPVGGTIGMDGNLVVGAADVDLYRFVAPATQTVAVETAASAEGSSNTFLRVFDADGNELASNDDAGPNTTGSRALVNVTAGQTYYIGVNGAGARARDYNPLTGAGAAAGSPGSYTLVLTAVPTPPPPGPGPVIGPTAKTGNVTADVAVALGRPRRLGGGRRFRQTLTLRNVSGQPLAAPLLLVLDGLSRGVRVPGSTPRGRSRAVYVYASDGTLAAGAAVQVELTFSSPTGARPRFRVRTFAGPDAVG